MNQIDLIVAHAGELLTCEGPSTGLAGKALDHATIIPDGAIAVKDGRIAAVGESDEILARHQAAQVVDAGGALVSPALVDPHTHLMHMGSREAELDARATGRDRGEGISTGGIRSTIAATSGATDVALTHHGLRALDAMALHGTGTVEAKTGYGTDMQAELRLLRLTKVLDAQHALKVIPTFLGAHIPPESGREAFVQSVIDAMPQAAGIARFCDIACDPACFTFEESDHIAAAATECGLKLRIHANQAGPWRGLELAAKWHAATADHGDFATIKELQALRQANTALVLLPGTNFHLMEMVGRVEADEIQSATKPHLPLIAARMQQAGCLAAAGTNYNPGSSPCLSQQMIMQLLSRLFRLGFAASWHMVTLNAAVTLGLADRIGSIEPGKDADFIIWDVERHGQVIDRFGSNHVRDLWLKGQQVVADRNLTASARKNHG